MTPEQYELLAALVGGAFTTLLAVIGGPRAVRAGLKWVAGYKERRAKAREELALLEVTTDAGTIAHLFSRLDAQDERLTALEAENHKLRDEIARLREENASLRARLERYERRSISPLPQQVHLPPPALVRSLRPKLDEDE